MVYVAREPMAAAIAFARKSICRMVVESVIVVSMLLIENFAVCGAAVDGSCWTRTV